MKPLELQATRCPISGEEGDATELYPANFDATSLSPAIFSARRLPDRIHYRIVRSNRSGLVRSDPIIDPALLSELYSRSSFDYGQEIPWLKKTYTRYLQRVCTLGCERGSLLEIGCGNGFFLEQAQGLGFCNVRGIEPSLSAVEQAPSGLRDRILCQMMQPGIFPAESFDLVCMFQILDHIPDPNELLKECLRLLKPGGFILTLNHNIEAWSARFLGERSPIIDLEHTFLFSPATMRRMFASNGFDVIEQASAYNTCSLGYLFRLVPLPHALKDICLRALQKSKLGSLPLTLPLGNIYLMARKPARTSS